MKIRINEDEKLDSLNYKGLQIIQKKDSFCFGMDAVILANFVEVSKKNALICDLGSGTGILSILITAKNQNVEKVYGIEIQKEMAEMSERSVLFNDLQNKIQILNEDLVGLSEKGWKKKFDIVVTNPPYKKYNTGLTNENVQKLISRHEVKCNLENVIMESSKMLKDEGIFYMVHRPERLVDICELMRKFKIEPKEIRFVYPKLNENSNLILIKGTKCGKPFLKIQKPLIVYEEKNKYSDEILKMYEGDISK